MVRVYSFSLYSRAVACQNHFQDDTHYTIKCQILSLSRCISLCRKLPITKAELICFWRTLQNVSLCSITGERHLKLELNEKYFCETLSLKAGMEIVFEFIDPTVNHVLF
ncbi:hypothetical protein GmHk_13G037382 [Glycine max]|nr:hypothetical protein GmHk_13G037382 [Glycine max]